MKIYIVERDNPNYTPEPEVFTDGRKALATVKGEYEDQMKDLGTSQEKSDAGFGNCGCYWFFCDSDYCCDCLIDRDCGGDRWRWRITEHEIKDEVESKIIAAYKEAVEFYNMVMDGDTSYADGYIHGMEKLAETFGYVLHAHHKNGLVGLEYDCISISKNGIVLAEIPV